MITGRGGLFTYSALSCFIKQNTRAVIRLYFLYAVTAMPCDGKTNWTSRTLAPVRVGNSDCAKNTIVLTV